MYHVAAAEPVFPDAVIVIAHELTREDQVLDKLHMGMQLQQVLSWSSNRESNCISPNVFLGCP